MCEPDDQCRDYHPDIIEGITKDVNENTEQAKVVSLLLSLKIIVSVAGMEGISLSWMFSILLIFMICKFGYLVDATFSARV